MTRPDTTTPATDWLAHHIGWPLALLALLAILTAAALILAHCWRRTGAQVDEQLAEYESWADVRWVQPTEEEARVIASLIARIEAERCAEEATLEQVEAYLADLPYDQESDR